MDLGLTQRVALVTGSSRGIGRATARLFAQEGARVAITYRNDAEAAQAVAQEIRDAGGEALVMFLDLGSHPSIHDAARAVLNHWGRLDILVNNAVQWGDRPPSDAPPFEEAPPEEWQRVLRSNIAGTYAAIQAVLPSMRERGWGRIVNVSSAVADVGLPGSGPYAAAKAALHGLTRTLMRELGPAGILTNVVMPGLTLTERVVEMIPGEVRDRIVHASPIGHLLTPEEVAPTIVFLCSAANTSVIGEVVRASGGNT